MKRTHLGLVGTGVVAVAGVAAIALGGRPASSGQDQPPDTAPATAAVEGRSLVATTPVDGTLGYRGKYEIASLLATSPDRQALETALAEAQAQYEAAMRALERLRRPATADEAQLRAQVAQAQSAVEQARSAIRLASAELAGAQRSLAGCSAASQPPCDRSALRLAVRQAQAQLEAAGSQLSQARAQRSAARAELDALLRPSEAQLAEAEDAVATARARLDAATGALAAPRGIVTGLAEVGSVVRPGEALFTLDGSLPVILLQGDVPAWRDLDDTVSDGSDVEQLEANLRELGFASDALVVDDHWDAETTAAVERWQRALGASQTGAIQLGAIVFQPGPMRITAHLAHLGQLLQAGAPVLEASSTEPVINVALATALQGLVKETDPVSITLPGGRTARGTVTDVATVATTAEDGAGGSDANGSSSIAVEISLDDPAASGGLDQAPVSVSITTATAEDVLAVPVSALVLTLDGRYAVQVVDGAELRYVPVELGLFAGGWVEVSGDGLAEGQHLVVAR